MRVVDRCPVCGDTHPALVVELESASRQRFLDYSRRKYGGLMDSWVDEVPPQVLHCENCSHYWYRNQPEPSQLDALYAAARPLLSGAADASRDPGAHMIREMTRLRRLCASERQPTLLDYGSGFGRWARAANDAGFGVTAYEPSVSRGAESQAPFELVHELSGLAGRTFDAIQLEQVLEHVPDPASLLRDVRGYCNQTTILRITVPNACRCVEGAAIWTSWPFDGARPHTLAPYEHLHAFTPRSFHRLLRLAGFEPLPLLRIAPQWPRLAASTLVGSLFQRLGTTMALVTTTR